MSGIEIAGLVASIVPLIVKLVSFFQNSRRKTPPGHFKTWLEREEIALRIWTTNLEHIASKLKDIKNGIDEESYEIIYNLTKESRCSILKLKKQMAQNRAVTKLATSWKSYEAAKPIVEMYLGEIHRATTFALLLQNSRPERHSIATWTVEDQTPTSPVSWPESPLDGGAENLPSESERRVSGMTLIDDQTINQQSERGGSRNPRKPPGIPDDVVVKFQRGGWERDQMLAQMNWIQNLPRDVLKRSKDSIGRNYLDIVIQFYPGLDKELFTFVGRLMGEGLRLRRCNSNSEYQRRYQDIMTALR